MRVPTPLACPTTAPALERHAAAHPEAEVWLDGVPEVEEPLLSGATTNPRLLTDAILERGPDRARPLGRRSGGDPEVFARLLRDDTIRRAAAVLEGTHTRSRGRSGWLSVQVDPRRAYDAAAMVEEARALADLAPNVMVKLPATRAGLEALEVVTAEGLATNTTLNTTLTHSRLALEAFGRGLARAPQAPRRAVLTFMAGRLGEAVEAAQPHPWRPGDNRRLELLALESLDALVRTSGLPMQLLVCSLRANEDDLAIGSDAAHLAAARGKPWVLTCPRAFRERAREVSGDPLPIVSGSDAERLGAIAAVRRALHVDGLSTDELDAWPALEANRLEHVHAVEALVTFARRLLEDDR